MTHKISLSDGHHFSASDATTILDAARAAGVVLEHSCSDGRCGKCETVLVSGAVESGGSAVDLLKAGSKILTCVSKPVTDIEIKAKSLKKFSEISAQTFPVKITKINNLTKDTLKISFRYPPSTKFRYIPGQYIDLIKGSVKRSYSLAGVPSTGKDFELIIRRQAGGEMSEILFNQATVDDLFRASGPHGTFCLCDERPPESKTFFIVTGTGIAPVLSIIMSANLSPEAYHVIWGCSTESDFFPLPVCVPDSSVTRVISRGRESSKRKRYVQDVFFDNYSAQLCSAHIYACGNPNMISDLSSRLVLSHFDMNHFYSDAFLLSGETA